jgi:ElaA protein
MIRWQRLSFDQLSTRQLYDLLKLRVDVFVVEQTCPYPELDDKDHQPGVYHLLGFNDDTLVASVRLLPAGVSFPSASIGRVVTKKSARGGGLGHQLMQEAIRQCEALWPGESIEIGAQQHLSAFYQQHGFVQTSDMYLEDGIPHIEMKLTK